MPTNPTITTADAAEFMAHPATGARRAPPSTPPQEDFLVENWLVQPSLGRVSRGNTILRLRPQLMNVLVCLASGNGRTVGRQELIDNVWDDRFVVTSAIARSVAELRQALGDDARHPRIIETIPKRGYRIVAPIARIAPRPAIDVAAPHSAVRLRGTRSVATFWPLAVLLLAAIAVALILVGRLLA